MTQPLQTLIDLIQYSLSVGATDLHICIGSAPRVRVGAQLQPIPDTARMGNEEILSYVRTMLTNKQYDLLCEQGALDFPFSIQGMGRLRCNIYSQRGTYAIALRMLPFDVPKLDTLDLPPAATQFIHQVRGLVLVVGATGSGKSTTLASLVDAINETYPYHILGIEDPIEYLHRHQKSLVTQREVGSDAPSFASALRSALREDPDVIMLGEMRDPETVSIALTAAETGHLVLSTLHTVSASKTIDRIIDAFPPGQQTQARAQLATVLQGIISQHLIPRADGQGLVLACEVLVATPAVRNLIRDGKHYQISSVIQTSQQSGMQLLEADLARLVQTGMISREEAFSHAQDAQILTQLLGRR